VIRPPDLVHQVPIFDHVLLLPQHRFRRRVNLLRFHRCRRFARVSEGAVRTSGAEGRVNSGGGLFGTGGAGETEETGGALGAILKRGARTGTGDGAVGVEEETAEKKERSILKKRRRKGRKRTKEPSVAVSCSFPATPAASHQRSYPSCHRPSNRSYFPSSSRSGSDSSAPTLLRSTAYHSRSRSRSSDCSCS
jgi:hypothetical protein